MVKELRKAHWFSGSKRPVRTYFRPESSPAKPKNLTSVFLVRLPLQGLERVALWTRSGRVRIAESLSDLRSDVDKSKWSKTRRLLEAARACFPPQRTFERKRMGGRECVRPLQV